MSINVLNFFLKTFFFIFHFRNQYDNYICILKNENTILACDDINLFGELKGSWCIPTVLIGESRI